MTSEISTEVEKAIKNVEDSRLYKMVQGILGLMGPVGDIVGKVLWVLSLFAVEEEDVWTQLERNMTLKVVIRHACILSIFIDFKSFQLKSMELRILNEIKSEKYHQMVSYVKSSQNDLAVLIRSYNERDLRPRLQEFIRSYQNKKIEYELSNLLDVALPLSRSFINVLLDRVREVAQNQDYDIQSSPHKLMYDFYAFIFGKVFEANNLLLFAVRLKNRLNGEREAVTSLCFPRNFT
jgi:hypothetical protein